VNIARGQIWYGWFPFKDAPDKDKHRPVLVLGLSPTGAGEDAVVLVAPITSFGEGGRALNGDVPVLNWRRCGLGKASWIRARRVWGADVKSLDRSRGPVGNVDTAAMDAVLKVVAALF
jgi:mRNA-degrading endonuclease toxin of MazEF toxin-antitoxin module